MKKKVVIIAEAGVNHNGSLEIAMKLIDVASDAKADFVKFQTYNTDLIVSKKAKKAYYQQQNCSSDSESQYHMLESLELSKSDHLKLQGYCKKKGIGFLSTGFDTESIDFLDQIGIPFFKIPSGEITNLPLIKHIAKKGKPIVMSTGMATLQEIEMALKNITLEGISMDNITILHCNTEYPTSMHDVNLRAMIQIKDIFGVNIGYSDHTLGIEVPIAAVALGATIIEKHFTLDRQMTGPDHAASLEPNELKAMVDAIRNIELALGGTGIKEASSSEIKNKDIARKSIHIANIVNAGQPIQAIDLVMKRPGDGISPMDIEKVIGKKVTRDLFPDDQLTWEDIE